VKQGLRSFFIADDSFARMSTMLRSLDRDSSLATAPGWDDVTGLGSPRAVQLVLSLR